MTDTALKTAQSLGSNWLTLYRVSQDPHVNEASYQAGKTPVLRADTSERSKGMTSDPTATAALDGRRIKLREALDNADRELLAATAALQRAHERLADAIAR
jgi:hypothetical protein